MPLLGIANLTLSPECRLVHEQQVLKSKLLPPRSYQVFALVIPGGVIIARMLYV